MSADDVQATYATNTDLHRTVKQINTLNRRIEQALNAHRIWIAFLAVQNVALWIVLAVTR